MLYTHTHTQIYIYIYIDMYLSSVGAVVGFQWSKSNFTLFYFPRFRLTSLIESMFELNFLNVDLFNLLVNIIMFHRSTNFSQSLDM